MSLGGGFIVGRFGAVLAGMAVFGTVVAGLPVDFGQQGVIGARMAEAFSAFDLIGKISDALGYNVESTAKAVLKHLHKSSVQMAYAKIKMGEALGLDPARLQGANQALRELMRSPDDLNAIRTSVQKEISEADLEARINAATPAEDVAQREQVKTLLKEAKAAQNAAHNNNAAAMAKAALLTTLVASKIHDNPKDWKSNLASYLTIAQTADGLLKEQAAHSKRLKLISRDIEAKWDVKEPTDKEVKQIEKKLDKELKPQ